MKRTVNHIRMESINGVHAACSSSVRQNIRHVMGDVTCKRCRAFVTRLYTANRSIKSCADCGQPMLPKGERRRHTEDYRHARGCPAASKAEREATERLWARLESELEGEVAALHALAKKEAVFVTVNSVSGSEPK